jgi:imidazole glycerol phosphate synthase subunit HisF
MINKNARKFAAKVDHFSEIFEKSNAETALAEKIFLQGGNLLLRR